MNREIHSLLDGNCISTVNLKYKKTYVPVLTDTVRLIFLQNVYLLQKRPFKYEIIIFLHLLRIHFRILSFGTLINHIGERISI